MTTRSRSGAGRPRRRWPDWVYGRGHEPDVRFSLANERTFLAWTRTALALLAAGVALDAIGTSRSGQVETVLTVLLVVLGVASAVLGWVRWARSERALRLDEPLPALPAAALLTAGLVLVGVLLLVTR